ncbi:MAG: hypothetical protein DA330_08565 [Nitrososphaera sp.]|nr:hypothetical protein [Nitrososphaera sp.]
MQELQIVANNKALSKVLVILLGQGPLPARKLLSEYGATGYGQSLIKQAVTGGLIARRKAMPEGKGNHLVVNALTTKGRKIARMAKMVYGNAD